MATRAPRRAPRRTGSVARARFVRTAPRVPGRADRFRALWRRLHAPIGTDQPCPASGRASGTGYWCRFDLTRRRAPDAAVWPSLAQIAGHMLDAIFIDTLDMDLERLLRMNQTLACIPDSARLPRAALQRIEHW